MYKRLVLQEKYNICYGGDDKCIAMHVKNVHTQIAISAVTNTMMIMSIRLAMIADTLTATLVNTNMIDDWISKRRGLWMHKKR